jgi:DNA-binding IclR family transcriptional regulator
MPKESEALSSLRRGVAVLEHLARHHGGMRFTELREVFQGLAASTLSRILAVLVAEGLVVKREDAPLYRIGPRAEALGQLMFGTASRPRLFQPILDALARETGHSAAYFEFDHNAIILLAKSEPPEAFHYMAVMNRNRNFGLHGFAKVCLAYQPEDVRDRLLNRLERPLTVPREAFLNELVDIRRCGVLVNTQDDKAGICRVAAPVFEGLGHALAGVIGISLIGGNPPEDQARRMATTVRAAAERAGSVLGASPPGAEVARPVESHM